MLKERTSPYRPGIRSPAWLKLKPKLTLDVVVTGGSAERVRWGDWGEAVLLAFRYTHPQPVPTWRSARPCACRGIFRSTSLSASASHWSAGV